MNIISDSTHLALIIFFLAHIAAAYYNNYSINENTYYAHGQDIPTPVTISNGWHLWQSIFNGIIAFFIGLYCSPYLGLQFIATRFLIFNPVLNSLRKLGFFHFGDDPWDVWFRKLLTKIFGAKYAGPVYFLLGVIIVVGIYALHLQYCWMNKTIISPYHCQ